MKGPFVLASLFLCCLMGELFGELIPESEYVLLDDSALVPDRRSSVVKYEPVGCVKEPDSKERIIYRRPKYTRMRGQFRVLRSKINIPFIRMPPVQGFRNPYPERNIRYIQNQKAPIRVIGNVPASPGGYKPMPGNVNEGKNLERVPQVVDKKPDFDAMIMSLLQNPQGRQMLRRMLVTEEVEPNSEGDAEEVLEY